MPLEKKRSANEMSIDKDTEIALLKEEIERLKAKLAEYENDLSDDDDEDDNDESSVCDGSTWSKKYFLLKAFKAENGHCKVPRKHAALGIWVKSQRQAFVASKMPQERVDKLNYIGFYWGKGHPEPPSWEDRFQELQKYYNTFGHCNIQTSDDPSRMTDLAKWVLKQRKEGKKLQKMKPSELTLDQYKQLNAISFKWKVPKSRRS